MEDSYVVLHCPSFTVLTLDIGEWFQENLGSDFKSDAATVVDHASSLLTGVYILSYINRVRSIRTKLLFQCFMLCLIRVVLIRIDNLTTTGNVLLGNLRNVTSELIIKVSTLRDDVSNLTDICTALGTDECDFLSSVDLAVSINYTNVRPHQIQLSRKSFLYEMCGYR